MDSITLNTLVQFTKILIGFFVCVFIPGYLFSFIFFPKEKIKDISYRLGIGFCIGLVFLILIGSILILSFGFLYSWMLATILLLSSLIVFIKLRFFNKEKIFGLQGWKAIQLPFNLLIFAAIGIYSGSYLTTQVIQSKPEDFFSEFYLLDSNGALLRDFRNDGSYNQALVIGVASHEQSPTDYSLVIRTENSILKRVGPFTVRPGERREDQITFSSEESASISFSQRLIFELYKDENIYRTAFVTVNKPGCIPAMLSGTR